jgi:pyruvate dehydrogenase E2 component (dihydrolipoamide acetyltransferase)
MFEKHLDLLPPKPASGWRKIALGTWRAAKDPSVYGVCDLPASRAIAYMEALQEATGERITITHFVGKVAAEALRRHPEINAVLRFGRLYPRAHVTLFFQAATDAQGRDLSGLTIKNAEGKSLLALAKEMNQKVSAVKSSADASYKKMKTMMARMPGWLTGKILDLSSVIQYGFNLWSPIFGTPKDPLGSIMITNIGSLGLEFAFAPLVPYSRVPFIITLCAIKDQVVAQDGRAVVIPMLRLCVTFDHRLIDGIHAAKLAKVAETIFADPEKELGPVQNLRETATEG